MIDDRYIKAAEMIEEAQDAMEAALEAVDALTDREEKWGETMSLHAWGNLRSIGQDYGNAVTAWRRRTRDAGLR